MTRPKSTETDLEPGQMTMKLMETDIREFLEHQVMRIFAMKNKCYAQTDRTKDGMSNFNEGADEIGITPEQVWHTFFDKHRRAFSTWMRTGVAPAPIYKIINDMVVYLLILYCKLVSTGVISHKEVMKDKTF